MTKIKKSYLWKVTILLGLLFAAALLLGPLKLQAQTPAFWLGPTYEQTLYESTAIYYQQNGHLSSGFYLGEYPTQPGSINYSVNNPQCEIRAGLEGQAKDAWSTNGSVNYSDTSPYLSPINAQYDIRLVNDDIAQGNRTCTLTVTVSSPEPNQNGLSGSKKFTLVDNDASAAKFKIDAPISLQEKSTVNGNSFDIQISGTSEPYGTTYINATANEWCSVASTNNGFNSYKARRTDDFSPNSGNVPNINENVGSPLNFYVANDNVYTPGKTCTIRFEVVTKEYDKLYSNIKIPDLVIPIIDDDSPSSQSSQPSSRPSSSNGSSPPVSAAPAAPAEVLNSIRINGEEISSDMTPLELSTNEFTIEGVSKPNTSLQLTLFSDPITALVETDDNGNWSYTFTNIPIGDHHVELVEADSSESPVLIANITVLGTSNTVADAAQIGVGAVGDLGSSLSRIVALIGIVALALSSLVLYKSKMHPIKYISHLIKH